MTYYLKVTTADPDAAADLASAVRADAAAAGARDAPVSDGVRLSPPRPRGGVGEQLLTLGLTVPVGITVDVAADRVKQYLRRHEEDRRVRRAAIRRATINWTEETVDSDGRLTRSERKHTIEFDEA
ncbi:hypothetical protein [Kitasatospora sp. NPDC057015]|uniref:hypothetical protein n=1 Tax=Kitasatospora sp. NPDC057015 TaxID=3346001 RepID=UPI0036264BDF